MRDVRVGVIGLGLIGGSVALAALDAGYRVFFYEPFVDRHDSRFANATRMDSLAALAKDVDLLFIATPVSAVAGLAKDLGRWIRSGATVSDLASVKAPVAEILGPALSGRAIYAPSHPMAGSERSGSKYAEANLFVNAITIVSTDYISSVADLAIAERFWVRAGSKTIRASVAEHDNIVGAVSHLPHLLAGALLQTVFQAGPRSLDFAGPALREMTRVAGASPDLWTEILLANRGSVSFHLRSLISQLSQLSGLLESADAKQLRAFLEAAKRTREGL
jgi:prephenate dehydrogenase